MLFFSFFSFLTNSYAADSIPSFECTLTDTKAADGAPGEAKDSFPNKTPNIYLICQSDQVKAGQKAKTVWIADDTNNVAPMNYKIDEKTFDVEENGGPDKVWTLTASISKPNNDWPLGSYHVDFYLDNNLIKSVKFNVE